MESTLLLNAKDLRKGTQVVQVTPWNFLRNQERKDPFHRDERGRCVYTPYDRDIYAYTQWTVHSVGKKIMRLTVGEEMKRRNVYLKEDGSIFGYFVKDLDDAKRLIDEMRAGDPRSTEEFAIEQHELRY